MKLAPSELNNWQIRTSALALAGLALAGCSSQNETKSIDLPTAPTESQPAETVQPTAESVPTAVPVPTEAPSVTDACTAIQVPVFSGSRFNQDNADSIQKQLDVLEIAKTPEAEVGVRTVFNANAIIVNALADNQYAESFASVVDSGPNEIPDAASLLAQTVPGSEQQCLTKEQLENVDSLYGTLVEGLGPQVGRQFSAAGQVAYDSLRNNYQKFQERYQEELANR